ncbi:hypothetical protein IWQ61_006626 [Dispira simplex]|nr:hypothetical protein IWQ61_006626 [Dispira simplex]
MLARQMFAHAKVPSTAFLTRSLRYVNLQPCRNLSLARPLVSLAPRFPSVTTTGQYTPKAWYSAAQATLEEAPLSSESTNTVKGPTRFDQVDGLSADSQRALKQTFRYEEMSSVQQAVLSEMPITKDLLVKAKTGTGKTLGFLLPTMEIIAKESSQIDLRRGHHVAAIIISPTRELANQIADEAEKLARHHRFGVMTMVGGTERRQTLRRLNNGYRSDIVVGTPGRIMDLLQSSHEFSSRIQKCKLLVLDEADELLNMGFRDNIYDIASKMPAERHNFLFSATLSPAIERVSRDLLHPGFKYIDTVDPNDVAIHKRVRQQYCEIPAHLQLRAVHEIITRFHRKNPKSKIMVFLPTTTATQLYGEIFDRLNMPSFSLHSKKRQETRSRVSQRFRKTPSSVLFTTDVSARGVDYPDVGLVLQVGIPQGRDEYIHRVGRTGRAGKAGEGIILLNPVEMNFLNELSDLNMTPAEEFGHEFAAQLESTPSALLDQQWFKRIGYNELAILEDAYRSTFAFYGSRRDFLRASPQEIVETVEQSFKGMGLQEPPVFDDEALARAGLLKQRRSRGPARRGFSSQGSGWGNRGFGNRQSGGFQSRGNGGMGNRQGDQGYQSRGGEYNNNFDRKGESKGYDRRSPRGYSESGRGFGSRSSNGSNFRNHTNQRGRFGNKGMD